MFKKYSKLLKTKYGDRVFAHTRNHTERETLSEHSEKTLKYFDHLVDALSLRKNIINISSMLVPEDETVHVFELIRNIVYHHDLGKINPVFQEGKMKNSLDIQTHGMDSNHSFYGNMLFDREFYKAFKKYSPEAETIFYLLSQTISRHHTRLRDINSLYEEINDKTDKYESESKDLDEVSKRLFHRYSGNRPSIHCLGSRYGFKNEDDFDIRSMFGKTEQQEALFYLYKITYSLLILSDYYATSDYMQSTSYKISTIDSDLIVRCIDSFYNVDYNRRLQDESFCKEVRSCVPDTDFNKLRTKILLEADGNLKKRILDPENRVFYLKVPTGGGKTNISIKLALTLLESKKDIKRVFYVFPFINIIEQNYEVIKATLGLHDEIAPIYSTSSWNSKSEDKNELLQYVLDNEFLNYPFVVMSNVNFFNSFVKSGKTANYRLVNLANSIIIIDEIQSINDKQWTLFNDIITYASKYLNIHFIIMSATLPRLDVLSDSDVKLPVCDLIEDPDTYFKHELFCSRTRITYRADINDLDSLCGLLKKECKGLKKILVVVNKVGQSLEIYKKIRENKEMSKNFDILLLNSTILSHRRKAIIKEMKTDRRVILVSTQSVEAGVDIDCDFGIRDMAIFDSIEQVAGRINRNSTGKESKLIVTNLKKDDVQDAVSIYRDSHRWQTISKKFQSKEDIQGFFKKRDFDTYYGKVLYHIKSVNESMQESSKDMVEKGIRHLDFEKLDEAEMIEQNSSSVVVDIDLDRSLFKENELDYLQTNLDMVSGREVWKKYNEFTSSFGSGHVQRKIDAKVWGSIMSKFTISIRDGKTRKGVESSSMGKMLLLKKEFYSEKEGLL